MYQEHLTSRAEKEIGHYGTVHDRAVQEDCSSCSAHEPVTTRTEWRNWGAMSQAGEKYMSRTCIKMPRRMSTRWLSSTEYW